MTVFNSFHLDYSCFLKFIFVFSCSIVTTSWTAACHAPLSMGFSLQKYWSRLPCPSPGDTPDLGIEPMFLVFPALQAYPLPSEPPGKFPQPCSSAINLHCPLLHLVGIEPTSLLRPIFPLLQWFLSKISFTALTTVQFWFYCEMGERL